MRQFKTVFKFELSGMLKNKSLIVTTIIMCIISLLIMSVPSFMVLYANITQDEIPDKDSEINEKLILVYKNEELKKLISPILGEETYSTEEELKDAVIKREVSSGFVVNDFNSYKFISYDRSINSFEQMSFESLLKQINENRLFVQEGMEVEKIREILNQPIEYEDVILGKDASSGMVIAFAVLFIMYMLILLYGTNVATSVAREKDSRTMELLITSTRPRTLILGKVGAVGLTGILQITAMLTFAVIGFILNKVNYPKFLIEMIKGSITFDTLVVYIIFSVLGYLLYLFIYASLGSLVSKVEDVNKAVAPITFLFILAYLAATFAMNLPDNLIIKITSFIPFISIFTMPIRYMLTSVSIISIIISTTIMIFTVILFAVLSIYIYRFGSLNYGNRLRIKEVIKSFKNR